jgi:hypothetical protein
MDIYALNELTLLHPDYHNNTVNRYGLYSTLVPQMVDAIRFLHKNHYVHLAVRPEAIHCNDAVCTRAVLTEPGRGWNGEGVPPPFAHEMMQQSVEYDDFLSPMEPGKRQQMLRERMERDGTSWEGVETVDWFALGGTFFFSLVGQMPNAVVVGTGPKVAEYFVKVFNMSDIPDGESIRDTVTQSLMVIDGLLASDRKKRVNLDKVEAPVVANFKARTGSLRASSVLQIEPEPEEIPMDEMGSTCSSYIQTASSESEILRELQVTSAAAPEFLQTLSC